MLQDYTYIVSRNLNFCKALPYNMAFSRIQGLVYTPTCEPRELAVPSSACMGEHLPGPKATNTLPRINKYQITIARRSSIT